MEPIDDLESADWEDMVEWMEEASEIMRDDVWEINDDEGPDTGVVEPGRRHTVTLELCDIEVDFLSRLLKGEAMQHDACDGYCLPWLICERVSNELKLQGEEFAEGMFELERQEILEQADENKDVRGYQ